MIYMSFNWKRMKRELKCFFGFHAMDTLKYEPDTTITAPFEMQRLTQRCLYCGKLLREYRRTPTSLRRIK